VNRVLVVGLGNDMRGDDVAGLLVARALREMTLAGVDVEEHSGDVAVLAESMAHRAAVVVVDAVLADAPPGTVRELDPDHAVARTRSSSHGLGVADAISLARLLDARSGSDLRIRLIGIVGAEFGLGSPPSAAVSSAAEAVAQRLATDLGESVRCA
jgi:hydrogenase maturation protease